MSEFYRYLVPGLLLLLLLAKFSPQIAAQAPDTVVTVTLSIPDAEADEGDVRNTAKIVLALDPPLQGFEDLGAPLQFSGGTVGTDFTLTLQQSESPGVTLVGRMVTFYASQGGAKATMLLTPILDSDTMDDVVTVSIPASYEEGLAPDGDLHQRGLAKGVRTGNGEITLLDASAPRASFAAAATSAGEDAGTHNVTVNVSPAPQSDITLSYTVGGTADEGTDYAKLSGSVKALANATSVNIPVSITDDSMIERNETVVLTLTPDTGYRVFPPNSHTLIIEDNDTPSASFASSASSAEEDAGTQNVTINLSPAPQSAITLSYRVGGSAAQGADYARLPGSVQVAAKATSVDIPVAITDDNLSEDDETVILTLTSGAGYEVGSPNAHTLTIAANDNTPSASFALSASGAAESAGTHYGVSINLDPAPQSAITLYYRLGGTASSSDYTGLTGQVQVKATYSNVFLPVTIIDDILDEDDETVELELYSSASSGYTVGSPSVHTLTIKDDDGTPSVRFAASSSSAAEDAGAQNVTINLSPAPQSDITLLYTVRGSASPGADYARLSSSASVSANATSATISVAITDDILDEDDETVELELYSSASSGYVVGSPSAHTLTITDNDGTPSVRFTASSSSAAEDAGAQNVTVNLSPAPQADITLRYTVGGTASEGADYASLSRSVSANATSATISVAITDDILDEDDETVALTLSPGANYGLGSPSTHTLTITDDDSGGGGGGGGGAPSVRFAAPSSSAAENAGMHNVTVNLSPAPQSDLNLFYRVGGTASDPWDYTGLSGLALALANATSTTIPVAITDDNIEEAAETVTLTLYPVSFDYTVGSPSVHTLTITDDDVGGGGGGGGGGGSGGGAVPSVSFSSALSGAAERAGAHNIAINLSPAPQSDVMLSYAVRGSASPDTDYAKLSGSVSVLASETSVHIPVAIAEDMLDEGDETIVLTLTSGMGYAVGLSNVHTFVIQDDDSGPAVRFAMVSSGAAESAGVQNVTVNLFPVPQSDITLRYTVGGTAEKGTDYTAGSVSVLASETTVHIPVTIIDDSLGEGDETVVLKLASGTGYRAGLPNKHTFVIQGDDGEPVVSITGGPAIVEGEIAWFKLTTTPAPTSDFLVNIVSSQIGDFGVAIGPWTTSAGTYNFGVNTMDDSMGEAHGSIRMTLEAGEGYTLGAPSSADVIITDNDSEATSIESAGEEIPAAFALEQNYPNPFNPSTTIGFSLARSQRVTLSVYDMLGQEVRVLVDGVQPTGRYSVSFDASGLASGTYLYMLRTEDQVAARTMALLK